MPEQAALQYYRYRISRDPKRLIAWFGDNWSHNRKLRVLSYLGGFAVVAILLPNCLEYMLLVQVAARTIFCNLLKSF